MRASFPLLTVDATTNPVLALPVNGRAPAEIMIVDLAMPEVNGLEICMAIRALPIDQRPAVIVMSGSADDQDREVLEAMGIAAFVPKDDELLTALGDALARARLR